jgi:photosystem II stability/assembly factor-like uncharacterized protein
VIPSRYFRVFIGAALAIAGCSSGASSYQPGAPSALKVIAHQSFSSGVQQIAARMPIAGSQSVALSVVRPMDSTSFAAPFTVAAKNNNWKLLGTMSGAIIHDIAFPKASVGYAAGEAGQVWKTTDGGSTWSLILNLSYPYYWYGVSALDAKHVVISGFIDSSRAQQGIIRWSSDGGATWSDDIVLTGSAQNWLNRVRFRTRLQGLAMSQGPGPLTSYYTPNGGQRASAWKSTQAEGGWFGNQFSFDKTEARASGPDYCTSTNPGASWSCVHSIDQVFDGAVFFASKRAGWVAGGEISPNVAGWVHRTTDGGNTWSSRTLNSPFPIRELRFITPKIGWAAGGNVYSSIGGAYFSADGGQTWKADLDSQGHELASCAAMSVTGGTRVWCAGFALQNSSFNSAVYSTLYKTAR